MDKSQYIKEQLFNTKTREALANVVADVDTLIPQSEAEFMELQKLGLYPVDECVPFVTVKGAPFYYLDNLSVVSRDDTANLIHYGDYAFCQLETLYIMARMRSREAHFWLKDNLLYGKTDPIKKEQWLKNNLYYGRVDARKKQEYKRKFRGLERDDWKQIQTEWMKYCLMLKYRDNALFRKDLFACQGQLPVEDATETNYDSRLFWGAELIELEGKRYYFGCNVLGKLLAQLRNNNGTLTYTLPSDLHLFGEPIINI